MAESKADFTAAQGVENVDYADSDDHRVHYTAAEEAAIIRKLDYRLLPFVLLLYSLSVLDRSNLGNAKLAGMTKGNQPHSVSVMASVLIVN